MANQPSFHILICLIQIWKPEDISKPMEVPDEVRMITEVEEIAIDESYQKLIGEASIKFPRGTVIKKTITEINGEEYSDKITANMEDLGVLITTRTDSKKAEVSDFAVGDRIRISLGLTNDPKIAALAKVDREGKSIHNDTEKLSKYKNHLKVMFDGYITECSLDTPITIKCENLASALKKKSCPNITSSQRGTTVNELLSDKGKYKLLEGTGLKLHPATEAIEINLVGLGMTPDLNVADVLSTWNKYKIHAYVKYHNGEPCIAVGRTYFSNADKDSVADKSTIAQPTEVLFDYHVASNDLTLMKTDKAFLAVAASSVDKSGKFYHITVRKNPSWTNKQPASEKYQTTNETSMSKKQMKAGKTLLGLSKDKVDLKQYTVIPYMSRKIGISNKELEEEAIKYLESYNMNGIDGTLTLFGDLAIRAGQAVRLVDKIHKQKNGVYVVEEVHTTFGVQGYRQRIKIPYLIARDKPTDEKEKN